ncbi:hypothetical protein COT48_05590 [Candidatus Woesearchaeota archaeon CG08_land_8_20_14_0_20_47_9]|nr:MAG: hypothetical protein AUJ69_02280 [Candidatus Woesearchaeota archaeon CG1_02_47_18]PIO03283.1 MAG: hypothetical protein COT48_05590 [Candidatus Woesearchaeota archaeon CG08_land_8_20_14_0_20_47_9]
MKYKEFILDRFQEEAIAALDRNCSVVVSAPTGSGKTLIADYVINRDLRMDKKIIYTAPIKALSNQKYKDFSLDFGEDNVGLLTGDLVINPTAPVLVMTTEVYRNMLMVDDETVEDTSYVVFDEIHYINDIERGYVWEESIILSPGHVRFLCLSATIPNAQEFASWIEVIKRHNAVVVRHDKRPVPLQYLFYDAALGITSLDSIMNAHDDLMPRHKFRGRGKGGVRGRIRPSHINLIEELANASELPCIFFSFSRLGVQKLARQLTRRHDFLSMKEKARASSLISEMLSNTLGEISGLFSTRLLRSALSKGIGFHHAGLLPFQKDIVERLFSEGLIKVLYATETFAVGVNMPARVVCFDSLRKFDGISFRYLSSKEYFQIAGRAGRRGIDNYGKAIAMINRSDDNLKKIASFTSRDIEPLHSQFRLSYNTILNLIRRFSRDEVLHILCSSFDNYQKFGKGMWRQCNVVSVKRSLEKHIQVLRKMGYIGSDGELSSKGEFASNIFCDELLISEVFATGLCKDLDEYQMLHLLFAIAYEPRTNERFFMRYHDKRIKHLKALLSQNPYVGRSKQLKSLDNISALVHPMYNGRAFVELLKNTTMFEGDVIRLFRQVIDRIGQVKKASNDSDLIAKLENCICVIDKCSEGICLL